MPVATPPSPATRKAGSAFAAECARIGADAQRFAWAREAGATKDKQLAELPNSHDRGEREKTLAAVYERRGSAPDIKASIEAECVVKKQKEADAAAALRSLQDSAGESVAGRPVVANPSPPATVVSGPAPPAAASNKLLCAKLKSQRDIQQELGRAGGTARTMDNLRAQIRRLDTEMSAAGC
ncbi:MAG: hypothetical protein KF686_18965 [Ramlibacter sp.]|nr:hypothetical protein [Ramlibacter sp.]